MKSAFLKTALVAGATLVAGAITSSASAHNVNFAFTGFCDGIQMAQSGVTYGGARTGCVTDAAGGVSMKVSGNPTKYILYSTSDAGSGVFTFFLDVPALTWYVYETTGGVFTEINSGTMTKGSPAAHPPGAKTSTSVKKTGLSSPF